MSDKKYRFQIIEKTINKGGYADIDTETNTEYSKVVGVMAHVNDTNAEIASTLSLSVDGQEVFPSSFPVSLITRTDGIGLKDVPWQVNEKASGSKVKGKYTDSNHAGTAATYTLKLILVCEE